MRSDISSPNRIRKDTDLREGSGNESASSVRATLTNRFPPNKNSQSICFVLQILLKKICNKFAQAGYPQQSQHPPAPSQVLQPTLLSTATWCKMRIVGAGLAVEFGNCNM